MDAIKAPPRRGNNTTTNWGLGAAGAQIKLTQEREITPYLWVHPGETVVKFAYCSEFARRHGVTKSFAHLTKTSAVGRFCGSA